MFNTSDISVVYAGQYSTAKLICVFRWFVLYILWVIPFVICVLFEFSFCSQSDKYMKAVVYQT